MPTENGDDHRGEASALDGSYRYASRLTRAHAKNFAYSFLLLTPERRRAISVIYAYSRRLDDCVDAVGEGSVNRAEAEAGLDRLRALLEGPPGDDPLEPALRETIRKYSIPVRHFHDLIEGMRMDLEKTRYATFEELRLYCYRVASTVGLICIEIFGNSGPAAREPAIDLGIAMQLTNVLRDIPEDLARGRIYIPGEDMERFGCREEDLAGKTVSDSFRALLRFEVERAREHFTRAAALLPLIRPESRRCPALLAAFYQAILDRIERARYDVLTRRPRLPVAKKVSLLLREALGIRH